MPRVFVGNFDFEHELTSGKRQLTREAELLAADLVSAWMAMADQADVIWSPTGVPAYDFRDLRELGVTLPRFISRTAELPRGTEWQLVPWGWTAELATWGRARGWHCDSPPENVVRQVNSRIFRWELEAELGVALPGSAVLRNADEVVAHLAGDPQAETGWVLKANYGMSGRERVLGRGRELKMPILNWIRKRCGVSAGVVYEPWLERVAEAGLQWEIPPVGLPKLLGITPLLTDSAGVYRGSRLCCSEAESAKWQPAVEMTRAVAQRLQQLGYFGPVGIDAMLYRTASGEILCRPLQDLNARHTMGRLALELRKLVPEGCSADWLHDADLVQEICANEPSSKVVQTTARSWLVIHPRCGREWVA